MTEEKKVSKSILELKPTEVQDFFVKHEQYCDLELPEYINFQNLLDALSGVEDLGVESWKPWDLKHANYRLFNNKDGEYAWRKLELIHPVLYIEIVKKITDSSNWDLLQKRFENFAENKKIICTSIPRLSKSKSIFTWKDNFEKESIKLSLNFICVSHTDIIDCYGSIYTHSIAWAVHGKEETKVKDTRDDFSLLGVFLDKRIAAMNNQQTNGIPQGSVLMDFIAEIVLGYIDLELSEKIAKQKIKHYKILRFRDDYRIFTNNLDDGKNIVKILSDTLSELGMRLNSAKTVFSSDIPLTAIKKDKLNWLMFRNQNIDVTSNSKDVIKISKNTLLDEILLVKYFLNENRNATAIILVFKNIYEKIKDKDKIYNAHEIIAVIVSILEKNPCLYHPGFSIISSLLLKINKKERALIIKQIQSKFKNQPNNGYLDLWIQFVSSKTQKYETGLCSYIQKPDNNSIIWEIEGLSEEVAKIFKSNSIVDDDLHKSVKEKPLIKFSGLRMDYDG